MSEFEDGRIVRAIQRNLNLVSLAGRQFGDLCAWIRISISTCSSAWITIILTAYFFLGFCACAHVRPTSLRVPCEPVFFLEQAMVTVKTTRVLVLANALAARLAAREKVMRSATPENLDDA